ncbi:MAG: cation diffusion facilitator family transporter [Acidimicrobiales bacterium]
MTEPHLAGPGPGGVDRAGESGTVAARRSRRLRLALGLNGVIVVVQIVLGIAAHSLGLLADAGHNLTDVAAVAASLVAVRWALRRPTTQRSFGYHRGTILAALFNAASILAITVFIFYEGVVRLLDPEPVSGGIVVVVAGIAAVVNTMAALAVREHSHGDAHGGGGHGAAGGDAGADLNMRSAMLHLVSDALASLGVAIAGAVILVTGGNFWVDPAVSLGIGALIAWQAWRLMRQAAEVLLESTPTGLDSEVLQQAMASVDGVETVHDLHVWSLSSEVRALSAHLVLAGHPSLEEAQLVGTAVKRAISRPFAIVHATLELECESCVDDGAWCAMDLVPDRDGHDHGADHGHADQP